ncbi:Potassium channel [Curvularia kusanoi]|uniref:Potassium channel n=1 Tax=Curvularia kusanoi TaxID=90978 RepID=A0A9P4T9Q8_CURKU|nr:Potassium channel [Curvularia kusanoi]
MFFFIWIAGGAAVYSRIQTDAGDKQWTFPNAMYFCYVTILTVGFGDLVATTDLGRGLLFPYAVGGIVTLALVVSSLYRAARELGEDNIVQKDLRRRREQVLSVTVTNYDEYRVRQHQLIKRKTFGKLKISAPSEPRPFHTAIDKSAPDQTSSSRNFSIPQRLDRKPRLLLLKEEKDRFDAMRKIQAASKKFKKWMGLFCYISLLTIGYGDYSPKSNPGRCFFVLWSLISVPIMTILVSNLGDTVVAKFKKWSNIAADFTVLPKRGIWQPLKDRNPWLRQRIQDHKAKRRVREGFETGNDDSGVEVDTTADGDIEVAADEMQAIAPNISSLAEEAETDLHQAPTQASLSRRIAMSIKKVSFDLRLEKPKRYSYEEWVEFTRLIRYTTPKRLNNLLGTSLTNITEDEEGLVNWDWLGEHSPMTAGVTESEWLLERLVESLVRLERRKEMAREPSDMAWVRQMELRPPMPISEECSDNARNTSLDNEGLQ